VGYDGEVVYAIWLTSVEVVFEREVVDLVLLIRVDFVFMKEVSDLVLLIRVEVAINSEVEDTTSLANIKEMLGSSVGAAASSLTSIAVVPGRAISMVTFSIGAAEVSLAIGEGTMTPVALVNASSDDAQDDNRGNTAVKMFSSTPTALNGGGSCGKETSSAISIERETFASTKARGPKLMSSGDSCAV
jgi:hypothetical protein